MDGSSQHVLTLSLFITIACTASKTKVCLIHIKTGHLAKHYIGVRIAQVRVVFQIPRNAIHEVAPSLTTSPHLAYVEWFSPLAAAPDPKHRMYKVTRMKQNGCRSASIIRVDTILGSVHLFPRFGATTPREWNTSFTVLDQYNSFYVNPFADIDSYLRFM